MLPVGVTGKPGVPSSTAASTTGAAILAGQLSGASAGAAYRTASIAAATRKTMRNPTPEMPSQPKSGLSGLSDCDMPSRPQEKPPYGQTADDASRAVQSPAMTAGSSHSLPTAPGQPRGTQRYASVIAAAPSATKRLCSTESADIGSGPRKRVAHSMWVR